MGVGEWFADFCSALRLTTDKRSSVAYRAGRIVGQLNNDFRGLDSKTSSRFYVGSYGRNTAIPSVSDVDILYEMPAEVYYQYDQYQGNGESAMLSAVRASVQRTYPTSYIAGDGQVVVVRFDDGIHFEVLPAFANKSDGYTFADTNGAGSWKTCKPKQELAAFAQGDSACNGNLVELCRMARAWRDSNDVPIGGMLIDTLAYQFIENWAYRNKSYLYYEYLTRDFFNFLANQSQTQNHWLAPGSGSYVYKTGLFQFKARKAELRSQEALQHLQRQEEWSAKQAYREIYGTYFPS
jgi:hypothetical protein